MGMCYSYMRWSNTGSKVKGGAPSEGASLPQSFISTITGFTHTSFIEQTQYRQAICLVNTITVFKSCQLGDIITRQKDLVMQTGHIPDPLPGLLRPSMHLPHPHYK